VVVVHKLLFLIEQKISISKCYHGNVVVVVVVVVVEMCAVVK